MLYRTVTPFKDHSPFRYNPKVQKFKQNDTHPILIASGLASRDCFQSFVIIQNQIQEHFIMARKQKTANKNQLPSTLLKVTYFLQQAAETGRWFYTPARWEETKLLIGEYASDASAVYNGTNGKKMSQEQRDNLPSAIIMPVDFDPSQIKEDVQKATWNGTQLVQYQA